MPLPRQTHEASVQSLADLAARGVRAIEGRLSDWLYAAGHGVWDDQTFPASGINPIGAVSDPDIDTSTGVLLFDASTVEMIAARDQTRHARRKDSPIRPHIHIRAAGASPASPNDVSAWRLEWRWWNNFAAHPAAYSSADIVVTHPPHSGSQAISVIGLWPEIDGTGMLESSLLAFRISRLATSALDTYAGDVAMDSFDYHWLRDKPGSREEYPGG